MTNLFVVFNLLFFVSNPAVIIIHLRNIIVNDLFFIYDFVFLTLWVLYKEFCY